MADNDRKLTRQIEKLSSRLDVIEEKLEQRHIIGSGKDQDAHRFCSLPQVREREFGPEVSENRASLIRYISKKWVNGTKLRYYFFTSGPWAGPASEMDLVREGFEVWTDVGIGLEFEEIDTIDDAEVRIGFLQGDGAWSYVGRDVIDIPGQFERTMNFGWRIADDPRGVDVPVHEIGHTCGFPHEHQNPFSGIVWDEDAVYAFFGGPPNNWSRDQTFNNVLRKLSPAMVEGSDWDPDSIMHYGFPAGLILQPSEYRNGLTPALGLSQDDIAEVKRFYPPISNTRYPLLEPFRPEILSLAPAEQANFRIEPAATREYSMRTFGRSDTVMVLFEERDGDLHFLAGDDDSGSDLNASITTWLQAGRNYVLRLRLYLNWASGDTAVMLW